MWLECDSVRAIEEKELKGRYSECDSLGEISEKVLMECG